MNFAGVFANPILIFNFYAPTWGNSGSFSRECFWRLKPLLGLDLECQTRLPCNDTTQIKKYTGNKKKMLCIFFRNFFGKSSPIIF